MSESTPTTGTPSTAPLRSNVDLVSDVDSSPSPVRWLDGGRADIDIPGARRVIPVPAFVLTPGSIPLAMRVEGDCMAPTIQDGDTVIVDCARDWDDSDIVMAMAGNRGFVLKRAYHDGDGIRLQATNGFEIKGEPVRILGRVVYTTHPVPRQPAKRRKDDKKESNPVPTFDRHGLREYDQSPTAYRGPVRSDPTYKSQWEIFAPTRWWLFHTIAHEIWGRTDQRYYRCKEKEAGATAVENPTPDTIRDAMDAASQHIVNRQGQAERVIFMLPYTEDVEQSTEEWCQRTMRELGLVTMPPAEYEDLGKKMHAAEERLYLDRALEMRRKAAQYRKNAKLRKQLRLASPANTASEKEAS